MRYDRIGKQKYNVMMIGLLAVAVAIIIMCVCYINGLQSITSQETDRYLMEVSQHIAHMVNYRVEVNHRELSAVGETYMQIADPQQALRYLDEKAKEMEYLRIGIADKAFQYSNTDGYELDVSAYEFIQEAMRGEESASEMMISPIDGQDAILYAVPLWNKGEVTGVLVAAKTKEQMQQSLDVDSFEGRGFAYIIDCDGNFIINSSNIQIHPNHKNFFETLQREGKLDAGYSLEAIRKDMKESRCGKLCFALEDGVRKMMNYVALDVDHWYLLSVVPVSVTSENIKTLIWWTVTLCTIIVLLFLLLILLIIKMQRKNQRHLERLAYVDPITGGFNKARFEQETEKRIRNAPIASYAMVSLDIERFKLINDTFGSEKGNLTLRYLYHMIVTHLESGEFAARSMADNFLILIKNKPPQQIIERFDKIAEELNGYNDALQQKYFITLTEGVYIIDDPSLDMITIQDRAVVARKNKQGAAGTRLNTCLFYTDVERRKMIREKEMENRMESALNQGEFEMYLQPKVNIKTENVEGAEALIRWNDPDKGLLSPAEFIPLFEKNEFVVRIDLFIFEQTCKMIRSWIERDIRPIPVSMNLSSVHLKHPGFLEEFEQVFQKYQIPPELLEIELTETLVFENMEALIHLIHQIHKMGFRFSLDDFGSGYSSLNILKEIPADTLKIDRAFFHEDQVDPRRGQFIVESVIDLAKKLHMQTVAEGVETIPQVEFLKKAGCDLVQGFVYSGPVSQSEFERMAFEREQ